LESLFLGLGSEPPDEKRKVEIGVFYFKSIPKGICKGENLQRDQQAGQ